MAWKVANYNALKREADLLRTRYRNLQKTVNETNVQLASLQTLASEISVATGFKQKMEGPTSIAAEGKLAPTYSESLQEYYFLRSVSGFNRNSFSHRFHFNPRPSIWPVNGRLEDGFGSRIDPFPEGKAGQCLHQALMAVAANLFFQPKIETETIRANQSPDR